MNSKNFSEAMNKLEDKYITEAITYNHKISSFSFVLILCLYDFNTHYCNR